MNRFVNFRRSTPTWNRVDLSQLTLGQTRTVKPVRCVESFRGNPILAAAPSRRTIRFGWSFIVLANGPSSSQSTFFLIVIDERGRQSGWGHWNDWIIRIIVLGIIQRSSNVVNDRYPLLDLFVLPRSVCSTWKSSINSLIHWGTNAMFHNPTPREQRRKSTNRKQK